MLYVGCFLQAWIRKVFVVAKLAYLLASVNRRRMLRGLMTLNMSQDTKWLDVFCLWLLIGFLITSTLEVGVVYYFHIHTQPFNSPFSGTTQVSRYQKGRPKTNLEFTEARDSEWQWHLLGHMQVCTLLGQITMPAPHHSVLQAGRCPSCRPTNSVKALKAMLFPHKQCTTSTGSLDFCHAIGIMQRIFMGCYLRWPGVFLICLFSEAVFEKNHY